MLMDNKSKRGRIVAIVTGAFSILIGVIYLLLITILDSRAQMLPPPPEALSVVVVVLCHHVQVAQPLYSLLHQ